MNYVQNFCRNLNTNKKWEVKNIHFDDCGREINA